MNDKELTLEQRTFAFRQFTKIKENIKTEPRKKREVKFGSYENPQDTEFTKKYIETLKKSVKHL